MNKIVEFSVKNRIFVFVFFIAMMTIGVKSFLTLPIDAVPDITNTQVQINTSVPGLIPEEVERMVTFPIEYSMNGIPGVTTIRSISKYGISQVTVVFEEDYDIYQARQLIGEKIQNVSLPEGLNPQMGPISTGLGEIFHYSIEYEKKAKKEQERLEQLMELRSLQEWIIKPRLLNVKGVTEVNTIGGFEKQYFIQPNIKEMARYGLHFDDIQKALAPSNKNVGGGFVQQTGEQLLIRGVGLLETKEDISNVIVKRLPTFEVIRIKDIANVELDKQIRTGAATVSGKEAVIGTAFMLLGENSRTVAIAVKEKLLEIKDDLPNDVRLEILYDRSKMVNATLSTVEHNLVLGALLVVFVLLLMVGNFRAALITALTIPLSLLITFSLMKIYKVSGNLMSLGALDFGIIIDGAVIVIENCVRRIREERVSLGHKLSREEIKKVVIKATSEIRQAAGFGELIVIVTFIPLFALTGIEGRMFGPMAMTFVMALGSALLLSFTLVPALAATFLSGDPKEKTPLVFSVAQRLIDPVLNLSLRFKKLVLAFAVLLIAIGVASFSFLGAEFIPQLDEGDFSLQMIRPANISAENAVALQKVSEQVIGEFPQVKKVFSKIGASEVTTDPMSINIADTFVMLHPKSQWPENSEIKTKSQLVEKVKEKLEKLVPAQVLLVSQPVELRFNELLEGTRAEVSAKVYGDDMIQLIELSEKLADILREIPEVAGAESQSQGFAPMLQYTPKKEALAKLGVTERPVLDAIETAIGGRTMGVLYDGVRQYPIVTRLSSEERKNINLVKNLPVGISEGFTLPIKDLADIEFVKTFSDISRENSQRRMAVLINPNTRDIEGLIQRAKAKVKNELNLPAGYFIEWGGSFKNLLKAKERLSVLVPLSLLLIICMLYGAFKNFYQVVLIFACAPLALVGGVLALLLQGMPFSISAGVGFIALSGISILNGVVLISYFNRLYKRGQSPDEIAKLGVKARLRPVLMTAFTDIFGFLPMMFSTGLGAEVQKPLATVVVGGMISSSLLTLVILPSLYSLFIHKMEPDEKTSDF